jgi:hypothetical protein
MVSHPSRRGEDAAPQDEENRAQKRSNNGKREQA